ncbi:MAG: hypothetical protein ACREIF_01290 [Chthoniobacterales bacterium]
MKTKLTLSLLFAALLPACTTTHTAQNGTDAKSSRYANNAVGEAAAPGEGPQADIPSQGPADVNRNPAYFPSPLLRTSAAGSP